MPLFASIPQFAVIPHPTKMEFLWWADRLVAHQLAYCTDTPRTTTFYISVAGSGTGDGSSIANAKACATPAALKTFIDANIAPNVQFLCKRGDICRATAAAPSGNVTLDEVNAKIGTYTAAAADGDKLPFEITGFKAAYGASGWTDEGSGVYSRSETATIYGVRSSPGSAKLWDLIRTPYDHYSVGADAAARLAALKAHTRRAWYKEGDTLYVQVLTGGTAERNRLEAAIGTGHGLSLNADKCLAVDLTVSGFMSDNDGGTYCIINQTSGTDVAAVARCTAVWGAKHSAGSIRAGSGGGAVWCENFIGLCLMGASGSGATQLVDYAGDGGHEGYRRGNSYIGSIRTSAETPLHGQASYAHTGGGGDVCGLILDIGSLYLSHPTHACGDPASAATLPEMASKRDYAACRCFIIDERGACVLDQMCGTIIACHSLRINPRFTYTAGASATRFAVSSQMGGSFNPDITFDVEAVAVLIGVYDTSGNPVNEYDIVHGAIRWKARGAGGANSAVVLDYDASAVAASSAKAQVWNTIWTHQGGSDIPVCGIVNQDARSNTGGGAGNAYFGLSRADLFTNFKGYSGHGAAVELTSPVTGDTPPPALVGTGVVLPTAIGPLEYDNNRRRRIGKPTIGPYAPVDTRTLVEPIRCERLAR